MTSGFHKISARLNSEKQHFKTMQMEGVNTGKFYNQCIVFASGMAPEQRKHNHSGYSADT